ncbi:hypothetical protein XW81_00560 [Buchnera aphidicola (Schlechtendalia chinensis)]|uniref:Ion-translocating oxidoreductase complex subunit G n=1 Tax=Buchnera aphidicola subsp. Schlechtendalia chinensis TaxID=118110 RepID=A0A172WD83_BUCSC|nr:electron transport complex subunit RsxG [Buchnera aphidicola]ANF16923.1 hypothetical protein XW81_00560 [Buchnera aphidicola (Schlechtendalia chinensis)]
MTFLNRNNFSILILFVASIITSGSVILVYAFTKPKIISQQENYQKMVLNFVIPQKLLLGTQTSCYTINNILLGDNENHQFWMIKKNNVLKALIFKVVAPDGYSGDIKIIISLNPNKKILGVRILDHHETPGLGDKIDVRISNWITKFSGITVLGLNDPKFSLKKYGGSIDQFAGATITPLAVINAIKRTVNLTQKLIFNSSNFKRCDFNHE